MKRFHLACAILILFGASLFAQAPAKLAFEVASIKPLPPVQTLVADIQSGKLRPSMLGTRVDGARVDIGVVTLSGMLASAYRLKPYQIVGPDWLGSQLYEIHATIPEGASKEQLPEMLQSLLAERFKLAVHHENREQPVYALVVSKGGPKLKEAVEVAETPTPPDDSAKTLPKTNSAGKGELLSIDTPDGQVKMKQEGRGIVVSGAKGGAMRMSVGPNGAMSMELSKVTMAAFADLLTQLVDRPVVDMTDLKGSYQVSLEIPVEDIMNIARRMAPNLGIGPDIGGIGAVAGAPPATGLAGIAASDPSGGKIFQALQQLGLKLDSQKMPIDTVVVDQIEKTPTEN